MTTRWPLAPTGVLRAWAKTKDRLALMKIAEDMPKVRERSKAEIIDYLMSVPAEQRRLNESYQIEQAAIHGRRGNADA